MKGSLIVILVFATMFLNSNAQKPQKSSDGFYYKNKSDLYNGTYKEYYKEDSVLKMKLSFENGLFDGISIFYYRNGQEKEIRSYKNGKKHGTWISWHANGVRSGEANYANGKKNGKWSIFDENGTLRYEMFYMDGKKTGTWYRYNNEGELVEKVNWEEKNEN